MIEQILGAAGGFTGAGGQIVQDSLLVTILNRFQNSSSFFGLTTWQAMHDFLLPGCTASNCHVIETTSISSYPDPAAVTFATENAAEVFGVASVDPTQTQYLTAGASDIVGGAGCYWSPQYLREFVPIQNQYQTAPDSTTLPTGLLLPVCYTQAGQSPQIVWRASMPNNIRSDSGGIYLNAPAFLFVRNRSSNDPAIVQIP
jgi:hypothetical protein